VRRVKANGGSETADSSGKARCRLLMVEMSQGRSHKERECVLPHLRIPLNWKLPDLRAAAAAAAAAAGPNSRRFQFVCCIARFRAERCSRLYRNCRSACRDCEVKPRIDGVAMASKRPTFVQRTYVVAGSEVCSRTRILYVKRTATAHPTRTGVQVLRWLICRAKLVVVLGSL
jgi:hypothetical protein